MRTVNVAKLKNELSKYLRLVQKGETIIVMDRTESVAQLSPIKNSVETIDEKLIRLGLLIPAQRPPADIRLKPFKVKGKTQKELFDDYMKWRSE